MLLRTRNENADIANNYSVIPLNGSSNAKLSEFRGSARNSELSLLVQGTAGSTNISGRAVLDRYNEKLFTMLLRLCLPANYGSSIDVFGLKHPTNTAHISSADYLWITSLQFSGTSVKRLDYPPHHSARDKGLFLESIVVSN